MTEKSLHQHLRIAKTAAEELHAAVCKLKRSSRTQGLGVAGLLSGLRPLSSLVRAHTTQLGIAFRPPVSEEASCKVVQDITALASPLLKTASDIFADSYASVIMGSSIKGLLATLSRVQMSLFDELIRDCDTSRLVHVSEIFAVCDKLDKLCEQGAHGFTLCSLEANSALLDDTVSELREWLEDPRPQTELWDSDDDEDQSNESPKASDDQICSVNRLITKLQSLKLVYRALDHKRLHDFNDQKLASIQVTVDELAEISDEAAAEAMMCQDVVTHIAAFQLKAPNLIDELSKDADPAFLRFLDAIATKFNEPLIEP